MVVPASLSLTEVALGLVFGAIVLNISALAVDNYSRLEINPYGEVLITFGFKKARLEDGSLSFDYDDCKYYRGQVQGLECDTIRDSGAVVFTFGFLSIITYLVSLLLIYMRRTTPVFVTMTSSLFIMIAFSSWLGAAHQSLKDTGDDLSTDPRERTEARIGTSSILLIILFVYSFPVSYIVFKLRKMLKEYDVHAGDGEDDGI